MHALESFAAAFAGYVWGLPLVFTLFGAGIVFTVLNRGIQFTMFKHAIDVVRGLYDDPNDDGDINHFQALCAALSATIGLGNIAGVAVAISAGGPGAVFWMWVAGVLGMATKYTSVSLSMIFREKHPDGHMHGGPMFTIKNGLGKAFLPLAAVYAFFVVLSSFGAGNMFQSNNLALALSHGYGVPGWFSGAVFAGLAWLVLVGGIKRIGQVAGTLVPVMVVLYFLGAIGIILLNASHIPGLLADIVRSALTGSAAVGGFAGASVKVVLVQGVRRAVFSNEAGMGSAAIAHAAAKTDEPISEGVVALLEPFIDTVVVCTLTALVMLLTGAWAHGPAGVEGAALTSYAFSTVYGKAGAFIVDLAVVLFAFSTIISWSYYGEQGVVYLWGDNAVHAYRWVFVGFVFIGAIWKLGPVLDFSDAVFGLLAIPNIIANLLLMGRLREETDGYKRRLASGQLRHHPKA